MSEPIVFDSGTERPDDAFWIGQGQKLVADSLPAIRDAAKGLMSSLGLVKGIYLGIIGFSGFVPKEVPLPPLQFISLFIPLVLWLGSIYFCMGVMMTKPRNVVTASPDSIQHTLNEINRSKQKSLTIAFWCFALGLMVALLVILMRGIQL